jgi:hypothetical protein
VYVSSPMCYTGLLTCASMQEPACGCAHGVYGIEITNMRKLTANHSKVMRTNKGLSRHGRLAAALSVCRLAPKEAKAVEANA